MVPPAALLQKNPGGPCKMNTITSRAWAVVGIVLPPLLSSGCVSKSDYDALQGQYQQLQTQNQQLEAQVARLQNAMAYTVNSDLLFKSGSWEMSNRGKEVIARLSQKLAPTQQNRLMISGYTDDVPIGPVLAQRGITSNQELSQKRADAVRQFLITQGVSPDMVVSQGFGEADPVASNETPKGRSKNRRVILSVGG